MSKDSVMNPDIVVPSDEPLVNLACAEIGEADHSLVMEDNHAGLIQFDYGLPLKSASATHMSR